MRKVSSLPFIFMFQIIDRFQKPMYAVFQSPLSNKLRDCSTKRSVTFRFFKAMLHNNANNRTPPTPYYMRHFQIFDKIDSFLRNISNALVDVLHIIDRYLFFSSVVDSTRKQSQAEETTLFEQQTQVESTIPQI